MSIEVLQRLRAEVDDAARARRAELDDLMDRRDALDAAIEALSDDGAGVEIRSRDEFVARFGPLRTSDVVDVMPPVNLPEVLTDKVKELVIEGVNNPPVNVERPTAALDNPATVLAAPAPQRAPAAEQPVTRYERTIIDTVRLFPRGLTINQIATQSGISLSTCRRSVQQLARTERLVAVGQTRSRRFLHPDHVIDGKVPPEPAAATVLEVMRRHPDARSTETIARIAGEGFNTDSVRRLLGILVEAGDVVRYDYHPVPMYGLPGEPPPTPRKRRARAVPSPERVARDQRIASHALEKAKAGTASISAIAADLELSPEAVRAVIKELVRDGRLVQTGAGPGTRYRSPGAAAAAPKPRPSVESGGSALARRRAAERAQNGEQAAHAAKGFTSRDCRNMVFKYVLQGVNTREHLLERTADVLSEEDVDQALSELVNDGTLKVNDYGRYSRVEREHIPGGRAGALKPRFNTAKARKADAKVRELGMLQRVQVVVARGQASDPGAIARHLNADPQEIVAAVDRLVAEGRLLRDEEGELSLAPIARRATPHVEPTLSVSMPGRRLEIG